MKGIQEIVFPLLPKQGVIIDVGAGPGRWSKVFRDMGYKVISIDKKERPDDLPDDIEWIQLDLNDPLPEYPAETFACVYLRNVIQFLPRERFTDYILPWAKQLLEVGGVIAIETFFGKIEPPLGPKPHPAYYTAEDLKTLCADLEIAWSTQEKADLKDMEGIIRLFSITQLVAIKR